MTLLLYQNSSCICPQSDGCLLNVQVVAVLKKDVIKSQSRDVDKGDEYRHILVQAIHTCAIKFPAIAANVVLLLMGAISLQIAEDDDDIPSDDLT